jgi:glycosyltransferase involved in cell wall biosynthesis
VVVTEKPLASVVIPAHNEETVIVRCLGALAAGSLGREIEVAVIANGCTDETARVAREFGVDIPELTVVELAEASKSAALNAGEVAVLAFPRIYLDADIVLDDEAMDGLIKALTTSEARVSSPHISFDFGHAHWAVRQFYRAYAHIPYLRGGIIGLGVYGVSEAGRRRFGPFPDLIADDLFVQRLFRPDERVTCPGTFTVHTPRTIRALLRVRTRTAHGNAQLARSDVGDVDNTSRTTGHTMRALLAEVLRRPSEASAVAVYAAVTLAARFNARRIPETTWLRDDSSRQSQRGSHPEFRLRR